jgi:hypothetical protein
MGRLKYLDKKILDNIELISPVAEKELKFVQEKDWSEIENLKKRESAYRLQDMLNARNLDALVKLYNLAIEDLSHPTVKSTISLLMGFYTLLEERYANMNKKFDWTEFTDDDISTDSDGNKTKSVEKKQEEEIEFQSGVLKDYSAFKEQLRKINFGDEQGVIDIPIHGDTPIPLLMRVIIEERYPEVTEEIEKKLKEGE